MSKSRAFLEVFGRNFKKDYGYNKITVGDNLIGVLNLTNYDGTIDIEFPLDGIDPNDNKVAVPIQFTYEYEDGLSSVDFNMDIKQYYSADDGELHDLVSKDKSKVVDYIKKNRVENDLEEFLDDLFSSWKEK